MHLTLHLTTACNIGVRTAMAPPRDGEPMSEVVGRQRWTWGRG